MNKIVNINDYRNKVVGEEIGSVSVYMYKDKLSGLLFFYIDSENEDVLQLSYIIEDALYDY